MEFVNSCKKWRLKWRNQLLYILSKYTMHTNCDLFLRCCENGHIGTAKLLYESGALSKKQPPCAKATDILFRNDLGQVVVTKASK